MILIENGTFHLQTAHTSYVFRINAAGHPQHLYYGPRLSADLSVTALEHTFGAVAPTEVTYDDTLPDYSLATTQLELPGANKGDRRTPAIALEYADGTRTTDFVYASHLIAPGSATIPGLPAAHDGGSAGPADTSGAGARSHPHESAAPSSADGVSRLEVTLTERVHEIDVTLVYVVYEASDVIARHLVVMARGEPVTITRAASLSLDLASESLEWLSLEGKWAREKQIQRAAVPRGVTRFGSDSLASSNDHNPAIALLERGADERHGRCFGAALVYSGSHATLIERSAYDQVRLQMGLPERGFTWHLEVGSSFATPQVVCTTTEGGLEALSHTFHRFVTDHIVAPRWARRDRPILFNSWEATYFSFDEQRLLQLASAGRDLGMELFVVDDGWFGTRDDDRSSLGDWTVDRRKLPDGLAGLAARVRDLGLQFGIWVEPEMVNPDSDLYRAHPEWALSEPGRRASLGRNQLTLDLANPEVVDYLESAIGSAFAECRPDYVKWDMNRIGSDLYSTYLATLPGPSRQAELPHRYILGLYDLLGRLTRAWPDTLFESCASGGNRFDLGMLAFMPQTWTSDNTEPASRLRIQHGSSLFYPVVTAGAHVGANPSHQLLRDTSVEYRFHVAAFGAFGYELDLTSLSDFERGAIAAQVELYREIRPIIQHGTFTRLASPFEGATTIWQVLNDDATEGIVGWFQSEAQAVPNLETIRLRHLDATRRYRIETLPHRIDPRRFGPLVYHLLPEGAEVPAYLDGERQSWEANGDLLMHAGMRLWPQFGAQGLTPQMRVVGDFGSRLYRLRAV